MPLNYGVFISTLDEDVTLEVRNLQVNGFGSARRFKVSRRGEKKIDYFIPEVTALDTSGARNFSPGSSCSPPGNRQVSETGREEDLLFVNARRCVSDSCRLAGPVERPYQ